MNRYERTHDAIYLPHATNCHDFVEQFRCGEYGFQIVHLVAVTLLAVFVTLGKPLSIATLATVPQHMPKRRRVLEAQELQFALCNLVRLEGVSEEKQEPPGKFQPEVCRLIRSEQLFIKLNDF